MAKRLLVYQIDHIKSRIRTMVSAKINAINEERSKEVDSIPGPTYWSVADAARHFNDGGWNIPIKKLVGTLTGYHSWDAQPPYVDSCVIDIMALSGMGKKNKKLHDAYDTKCNKIGTKYNKRTEAAKKAGEDLITKLVLGGAEEFQKAIDAFEIKVF